MIGGAIIIVALALATDVLLALVARRLQARTHSFSDNEDNSPRRHYETHDDHDGYRHGFPPSPGRLRFGRRVGGTSTESSGNGKTTRRGVTTTRTRSSPKTHAQALGSRFRGRPRMRIGQREVSMPELEAGSIDDVFPEYTGNPSCITWITMRPHAPRTRCTMLCAPRSGLRALENRLARPTRIPTW